MTQYIQVASISPCRSTSRKLQSYFLSVRVQTIIPYYSIGKTQDPTIRILVFKLGSLQHSKGLTRINMDRVMSSLDLIPSAWSQPELRVVLRYKNLSTLSFSTFPARSSAGSEFVRLIIMNLFCLMFRSRPFFSLGVLKWSMNNCRSRRQSYWALNSKKMVNKSNHVPQPVSPYHSPLDQCSPERT